MEQAQTTFASPRSIPHRLELQPTSSEVIAPSHNWIADLSLGLQQICGSPPSANLNVSGSSRGSDSSGGFDDRGRRSPLTPVSAMPSSSRSGLLTPPRPATVAFGLAAPVFTALSPVCSDCFQPQQQSRHRRSTPSPPVVVGLPPIPEPTAALSPSSSAPIVSRSRIGEGGIFRRTVSLIGGPPNIGRCSPHSSFRSRPIIVRHVETHERLDKQLSDICNSRTSPIAAAAAIENVEATTHSNNDLVELNDVPITSQRTRHCSPSSIHRSEPISHGAVRLKVNVAPYQAEDLVISIHPAIDRRRLGVDVEAISGGGADVPACRLHHSDLLLDTDNAKRLLCHMTSGGWLYIREQPVVSSTDSGERSASALSVDCGIGDQAYVPIMYCNEDRLELTFVVHLPDRFRFEDVGVKTVDDRVVITGSGNSGQSPLPCQFPVDGVMRFFPMTSTSKSGLKIVIPLPEGTDNRSVIASLTSKNQLIIVAKLSQSSYRRYTF